MKYTCRECAKSLMHYFTPIQYHLKSCHSMTMEEYGEKHEGQSKETAGNSNSNDDATETRPNEASETVHNVEDEQEKGQEQEVRMEIYLVGGW